MSPAVRAIAAVTFAAAIVVVTATTQPQHPQVSGRAEVTDGDTLVINGIAIRLDGFDSPERGHRCAGGINPWTEARDALREHINGRPVNCAIVGHDDNNNRQVGRCSVEGVELGDWMVRNGWARDWPRYSCGAYAEREAAARAARVGLWGLSCPDLWGARNYTRQCPEPTRP